jgi:hypothetical protein
VRIKRFQPKTPQTALIYGELLKIYGATTPLFELGVIPNTKKNNNQEKSNIFNQ